MALTTAQRVTHLKQHISRSNPLVIAALAAAVSRTILNLLLYNLDSTFVVWRRTI